MKQKLANVATHNLTEKHYQNSELVLLKKYLPLVRKQVNAN
jgi:hypothetical protein